MSDITVSEGGRLMSEIRVLVVPADEATAARVERTVPSHDVFTAMVDDLNTDTVFFSDGPGVVVMAANGKSLAGHGPNPRATQIVERFLEGFAKRDRVEGPALFVGLDSESDFTDVPAEVTEFAGRMFSVEDDATG